ncbi:unnamed protein product [Oppiella nova]|uniref:Uncharacterized protein n=1 Tax=Oppiella nova TaxID=334625 RepID=A0A7R9LRT2_9ACAR|nr:unnamed protein product [Oppiella nova]CAG2165729.1 unnamed protein product [Oppiella nova]
MDFTRQLALERTIDTTITNKMNVARIGAIFTEDQKDSQTELAFKYAVYRINRDKNLLPNTTLIYDIQVSPNTAYWCLIEITRSLLIAIQMD